MEELLNILKLLPAVGGSASMAIVLYGLYNRKLAWYYQVEEQIRFRMEERETAERRRIEERDMLRQALKEKSDECSAYTQLAREALFSSRKAVETAVGIAQTMKEGGK